MRKVIELLVASVLVVAALVAITTAQSGSAEQQIRAQIAKLGTSINPRVYTPDAIFWSGAYSKPIRRSDSEASTRSVLIGAPGRKNVEATDSPEKIVVSQGGDMAYEYGTFKLKFDDNVGHHDLQGALLRVWQKIGGEWKIVAHFQRPYGQVVDAAPNPDRR